MPGDNLISTKHVIAAAFEEVRCSLQLRIAGVSKPLLEVVSFRLSLRVAEAGKQELIADLQAAISSKDHIREVLDRLNQLDIPTKPVGVYIVQLIPLVVGGFIAGLIILVHPDIDLIFYIEVGR